jgi:hypothetical protein
MPRKSRPDPTSSPISRGSTTADDAIQRSDTGDPTRSTTVTNSQPWQRKKNHQSAVRNSRSSPLLGDQITDRRVFGFVVTGFPVEDGESALDEPGGRRFPDDVEAAFVACPLGGVSELLGAGHCRLDQRLDSVVFSLDYVDKQLSSSGTCSFPLMSVLVNHQGKWQLFESDKWPNAFP